MNCLNFGNPEHPEVMWQFAEVVEGMSEACEALGIPVVGGNVPSTTSRAAPTSIRRPSSACIGLIDELDDAAARAASARRRLDRRARRRPGPSSAVRSGPRWCTAETGGMPPAADLDGRARAPRARRRARAPTARSTGVHDVQRRRAGRRARRDGDRRRCRRSRSTSRTDGCTAAEACFAESASRVVLVGSPRPGRRGARRARSPRACRPRSSATRGGDRLVASGAFDVAARRRRHAAWRRRRCRRSSARR